MRQRGFTLLEMIVATTIMGIAVVGLLSAISQSTRNAARLREYGKVVQLARLRMNELLVDPRLPRDTVMRGEFSGDSGWQARLSAFEMPPVPAPGQLALDRIELEVWWMSGTKRRTFSLDAFRPRVLRPEDIAPVVPQ
jgi:general secretion pathway protein I